MANGWLTVGEWFLARFCCGSSGRNSVAAVAMGRCFTESADCFIVYFPHIAHARGFVTWLIAAQWFASKWLMVG